MIGICVYFSHILQKYKWAKHRQERKKANLTQKSGHRGREDARSALLSLLSPPPLWILASLWRVMILSTLLRLPLLDISTWGEGCSCLSRHITDVLIPIPPIQHPVMLLLKKLPVHHKHPPFYVPRPRRERKERNQPSLKHKLTALSRLTWHQRRDVPDVALNFHNKVTPQLLVTPWDHAAPKTYWNIPEFVLQCKSTLELTLRLTFSPHHIHHRSLISLFLNILSTSARILN